MVRTRIEESPGASEYTKEVIPYVRIHRMRARVTSTQHTMHPAYRRRNAHIPRILPRVLMVAAVAATLWSGASAAGPDVNIDIGLGMPPIVLTAPPPLVVVPDTPVYYAPDIQANLFVYKGRYYTVANGVWAVAPAYNGPWAVNQIGQVP
jgi:hypothetical protein